ncbi:acetyl-CoA/propionyl-CoA carboxylase, biotin carboxylase, biotin carboxyl carrier protein [Saccharopolyspora antimicrobica]|uniref:Biotin-dependent 3-methylcrotonyl-coenzyme A carboxylase alpha1 subunit n=1 Tax=Saccharopolyspora antimicrobica TaxID=455193 RepID=A0A1I4QBS3_9PSEU|nr:acetyl/propionyl/methylcrotonyl-CoA carboxylase subunit alpha [Saccharopolyspora antimicrobica]RKT84847.1 acetyl-CoA/propionyl-CoA carboxylase, biotin carboxylase, biotin carboxyl carrier protein [Saccharopolyspora antimicrobica]SFM37073.1 acetyl-CoA/propionyl-CoA carboxylase, biotin carboxylase, biotin carboxyl carrier protein [Saccharopolyspora antimicrobica]
MTMQHFDAVLVANRGEIAVRVIRTLRELGIRSVAVYSDADRDARHVREADTAVHIGPSAATESYLDGKRILDASRSTGAQAIHPGYGFLAENAAFAKECANAGIEFIGPPPTAIESMGDKIRAKQTVSAADVPVVPGRSEPDMTDADLRRAALEIGFPVLLKPSAGGGGKGMRLIHDESALDDQIASARREARSAFGDDTLFVERFVARPRHIEVQVLADAHGNVVHLGERECSLQRRHQKIIEEAPSPLLDAATRARIGAAAVNAARSVGYVGAGTVEFIVSADRPDEFFFMEMNTRLQVEHPVTELVTTVGGQRGIDLVEQQVRVAAGEPLPWTQQDIALDGHAVEARVYAEDPTRNFLPTGGDVLAVHEPTGPGVRVDSGIRPGARVGSDYDPMLAKVIAWGPNRTDALRRLDKALGDTAVLGLQTNVAFLRALLRHEQVQEGALDTGLVERELDALIAESKTTPDEVYAAAALERLLAAEPTGTAVDPWDVPDGWRLGESAWSTWRFAADGDEVEVRIRGRARDAEVSIESGAGGESAISIEIGRPTSMEIARHRASAEAHGDALTVTYRGRTRRYRFAHVDGTTWLAADGRTWALAEHRLLADRGAAGGRSGGAVTSPMPGTVLVADVSAGQQVTSGQRLFVVEAMKMEHTITAPIDGVVTEVHVRKGQSVGLDQPLAVLTAPSDATGTKKEA